jgi:hypothetical protein
MLYAKALSFLPLNIFSELNPPMVNKSEGKSNFTVENYMSTLNSLIMALQKGDPKCFDTSECQYFALYSLYDLFYNVYHKLQQNP